MKKILSIALALILLTALVLIPTSATETNKMKVNSAYYASDTLYAFVEGIGIDPSELTVRPRTDAAGINHDSPKPITDTDTTIEYVLLIDASASIQWYLDNVFAFVSSLMNNEQLTTTVSVASFGENFDMVREELQSADEVNDVVRNEIDYNEPHTNICGSVISAIEYIHGKNRTGSKVINLVVITDGQPDLNDTSPQAVSIIADAAEEIITTCPEIILHTICFGGNWESDTFDALSKGSGIHETINTGAISDEASSAGQKMAQRIDSLYTFSLPMKWDSEHTRADVQLRVEETDQPRNSLELFTVKNVADLEHIAESDEGAPAIELETKTPDGGSGSITPENPSSSQDETSTAALEATADQPNGFFTSGLFKWILIAAGAVIIAAAAVIIIIVILKKRKKSSLPPASDPAPALTQSGYGAPAPAVEATPAQRKKADGPSITMKLKMIEGVSPSASKPVELVDEIIIGSAPDCDIILNDPAVSAHNARVFVENSMIYIENISSTQNTYLEGMKLFSRNRLRSQSEITIGNTTFTLLF